MSLNANAAGEREPALFQSDFPDFNDPIGRGSGLADCFATAAGMRHEIDDSTIWTRRGDTGW